MNRLRVAACLLAVIAAASVGARAPAPALDEQALLKELGFSAQDLLKIGRGEIIGRTTQADSSAVALVVAGTIAVPSVYYLEKFRAIESFKKTAEVLQIGRVNGAPSPADFAALTLDQADVDDLKDCRVGDCGVKLDADGVARLARRDAQAASATAEMRQYLAGYAQQYLQRGNGALMEYRDNSRPRRVADELRVILDHSRFLQRGWPTLHTAVGAFTGTMPDGLDHFVYWSKEKIGPRAVISLTHAIIRPPSEGVAAIATKQIFASHYSTGSLGMTMLLDKGTPEAPRTLIVYVNRSRLDIFGGILGTIKRPLVRSRARDGAERMMRQLRDRLERDYRKAGL
ncbi:MAG TPA: hypothetical protein VJ813_10705 [Vicinamibacterales bacterium]|nr:hypothetical protein [Vicinamibacterales bacterium]